MAARIEGDGMKLFNRAGYVRFYRQVMGEAYDRLPVEVRWTFDALVQVAGHRDGIVPGSAREIAPGLGMSDRTLTDHLRVLEEAGEIEVVRARNQHEEAGVLITRYAEITTGGARETAQHDESGARGAAHGARGAAQQTTADLPERGSKKLRSMESGARSRPEEDEETARKRPPSPFDPNGHPRERAMLQTLVEALGHGNVAQITSSYRGGWTRAVRDLLGAGAVPAEVGFRVAVFKDIHGRACRTPGDLTKLWGTLRSPKADRVRTLRKQFIEKGATEEGADAMALSTVQEEEALR